jgi:hypothetical protein
LKLYALSVELQVRYALNFLLPAHRYSLTRIVVANRNQESSEENGIPMKAASAIPVLDASWSETQIVGGL